MLAAALFFAAPPAQDHVFPGGEEAAPVRAPKRCAPDPDGITVCATDPGQFRATRMEAPYREKPIRARVALPGGRSADAQAVQRPVGNQGVSAPSLMFNLRVPIGKGKKGDDDGE